MSGHRGTITRIDSFIVNCLSEDCESLHAQSYLPLHEFYDVIRSKGWRLKSLAGWHCPECDAV
jgi:hypothetical protein